MATYEIKSPQGETFEVTGPDNVTPDQVLQYAKKNMPQAFARQATGQDRLPPPVQLGQAGMPQAMRDVGSETAGPAEKIQLGALAAGQRVAHGLGLNYPAKLAGYEGDLGLTEEAVKGAGPWAKGAQLLTEGGMVAMPSRAVATGVASAFPKTLGRLTRTKPGMAAVEGGTAGAMLSPEDRLTGAGFGAGAGLGLQQVGSRLGRTIAEPIPQTPMARNMRREGIPVTAGQGADMRTMRGAGMGAAEESISRVPVLGSQFQRRRVEALDEWRRRAMQRGTPKPENIKAGMNPEEQLAQAAEDLNKGYRGAVAGKTTSGADSELLTEIIGVTGSPQSMLTKAERKQVEDYVMENLVNRIKPGDPAQLVMDAQSILRSKGRQWMKSGNPAQREQGQMLNRIADASYDLIDRTVPGSGDVLRALKAPRARYGILEKAYERTGGAGEFTPGKLRMAARGQHPEMRNLGRRGEEVLGNKDPGATRQLTLMQLLAGGVGIGSGYFAPPVLAGALASLLASGTKTGQRVLSGNTKAQRTLSALLRRKPMTSGAAGGVVGSQFADEEQ